MRKNFFELLGPGLISAGAAVGVSHLVQSTRAGANYSFELLIFVVLANVLKFPTLEVGIRAPLLLNKDLIQVYRSLGKFHYISYALLTLATSFIVIGAITLVTSGIFLSIFPLNISLFQFSILLTFLSGLILIIGGYRGLDSIMKYMIIALSLLILTSFFVSLNKFNMNEQNFMFHNFSFSKTEDVLFLMALIGWMPIPVDASVWQSIWFKEKGLNSSSKLDFHIGYWTTMVLAILFLSIGAINLYPKSLNLSTSGITFSSQLVHALGDSFGTGIKTIMSFACLATMLSTLLTCLDAYSRVLDRFSGKLDFKVSVYFLMLANILFLYFFSINLKQMVDFATLVSFLVTPLIIWFNYCVFKKTKSNSFCDHVLHVLHIISFIFFVFFSLYFLKLKV